MRTPRGCYTKACNPHPRAAPSPPHHGLCQTRRLEPGVKDRLTSSKPPALTCTHTSTAYGLGTRSTLVHPRHWPEGTALGALPGCGRLYPRSQRTQRPRPVPAAFLPKKSPPAALGARPRTTSEGRRGQRALRAPPVTGPGRATRSLRCQEGHGPPSCPTPPLGGPRPLRSRGH